MQVLPEPLPDELLYSVLARTAYHYGYWSPKQLLRDLYHFAGVLAVPDLPSNLAVLARENEAAWHLSPDDIAIRHTLAGYYTHYLGAESRRQVLAQMSGKGGSLQVRLGVCAGSAVSPRRFRFCAQCRIEDIERFGETYWHRGHHLPGVLVCHRHGQALLESEVPFRPPGRHEYMPAPLEISRESLLPLGHSLRNPDVARLVAMRSASLLDGPVRVGDMLPDYRVALDCCGFSGGRGGAARLRDAFLAHFGDDLLAASFRGPPGWDRLQWLAEVLRVPRRPMHPFRHVLMDVFLDAHLGSLRAETDTVEHTKGQRWGIYRHAGLRLQAAGMAAQGFRTHSIARALDVDWKTAARLLLPLEPRPHVQSREPSDDRAAWATLVQTNPSSGTKALRKLAPALYARLYRNERTWLKLYPTGVFAPAAPRLRMDWRTRDAGLEAKVRARIADVLKETPMKRASRSHVLGALGVRALVAHKAIRLPRTVAALELLCESVETFQVRRLVAVLERHAQEGQISESRVFWEARIQTSRLADGGAAVLAQARLWISGSTSQAGAEHDP